MSEEGHMLGIKRVLVALDASSHSLAALDAAIDLAVRFQAELVGIYVEDENLLRLAALPFVQEVGHFSATRRRLDRADLERQIRGQRQRVRSVFSVTTRRAQVTTWSFRSVRGTVLSEILAAAAEADLLVLGNQGWSLYRRGRLGSTVRGLLPQPFGLALVVKEGARLAAPFAVVYDGSPAADRSLIAAQALRRQMNHNQPLVVLVWAVSAQSVQTLQIQAASRLAEQGTGGARYRALTSANVLGLADILLVEGCGTLVLPARSSVLQNSLLLALLEQVELPMLLVT